MISMQMTTAPHNQKARLTEDTEIVAKLIHACQRSGLKDVPESRK